MCEMCNLKESDNVDRQKEIYGNGSKHKPAGVRPATTAQANRRLMRFVEWITRRNTY
jgi:hypothetical protein